MLDERAKALLQFVNGCCDRGEYKIFAAEDFSAEALGEELSEEELSRALARLEEDGYIAVKYASGGMYCLRPLPHGKGYCEQETAARAARLCEREAFFKSAFFGGLSGGALGGFFSCLLGLLLR